MEGLIHFEKKNYIAVLTINREQDANALSKALLIQFNTYLQKISEDKGIRVVIITGAGNRVFCAGADLKERNEMSIEEAKEAVALIGSTINTIEQLPQPVLAALNGSAFGGGLELALACDIRIATKEALMGLTEVSLGIIPGAGGTQRLPRIIGETKAKELIYTAKRIHAEEALQIGLINFISERSTLMQIATEIASTIAHQAPLAVQQAKKAINEGVQVSLSEGLQIEALAYEKLFYTEDRLEGLLSFQQKRTPQYKGH